MCTLCCMYGLLTFSRGVCTGWHEERFRDSQHSGRKHWKQDGDQSHVVHSSASGFSLGFRLSLGLAFRFRLGLRFRVGFGFRLGFRFDLWLWLRGGGRSQGMGHVSIRCRSLRNIWPSKPRKNICFFSSYNKNIILV